MDVPLSFCGHDCEEIFHRLKCQIHQYYLPLQPIAFYYFYCHDSIFPVISNLKQIPFISFPFLGKELDTKDGNSILPLLVSRELAPIAIVSYQYAC